ncbi:hypothetical protein Ocin01_01362 [Orchesella cincta]|uniref:Uncharacterized protein n=1 Tax=Orchesella cincta TaxID=48709 RepID=A0A1D2NJB7_ORCCI|nr:hypothetical protein Ocin01_01362 [Orchesella cincta]
MEVEVEEVAAAMAVAAVEVEVGRWLGWKKPKIHHIHYAQPHFPDGKPLHVVKHPQKHIHHQEKGWGWGGGGGGGFGR